MPLISIVIVTWNSQGVLEDCVSSLFSQVPAEDFELILVDNASQDQTYLNLYKGRPNVRVILNEENLGFSKAVNIGFQCALGSHFLALNPDIVFQSNPFPRLLEELRKNPSIGAIGPLLHDTDGNPQIRDFYPTLPSLWQFIFYRSLLVRLPPIHKFALQHFHARIGSSGIFFVDQIPGAFLLFRRDLFGKEPVLNEAFFIWMEDVDFCLRLKARGLKAAVVVDEKVTHIGGYSFQSWSEPRRIWMFNNSYLTYLELNTGPLSYLAHTTAMAVNSLVFLAITPIYHARKGRKFVMERLQVAAQLLRLILRRMVKRFFR